MNEPVLNSLRDSDALKQALDGSAEQPLLIFKHSLTCPISTRAYQELKRFLQDEKSRQVQCALVIVQTARSVSNEIAARLNIQHESPQAILVKDGRAVWNTSHFNITCQSLTQALSAIDGKAD